MKPRARDVIGALLLTFVLIAAVVVLVLGAMPAT